MCSNGTSQWLPRLPVRDSSKAAMMLRCNIGKFAMLHHQGLVAWIAPQQAA
jgi:hypothetical protein